MVMTPRHDIAGRWLRFTVAGSAGFAIQLAVMALLTSLTPLHYAVATIVAVEAAILSNYWWHERWTWRDRPAADRRERWRRLARFNALTAVTSIAGSVILTALLVESTGWSPVLANAASVVLLSLLNFAAAHTLVFRATAVTMILVMAGSASAEPLEAILQPKTAQGFARYAAAVESRIERELRDNEPFLDIERQAPAQLDKTMAALRRGEVVVSRAVARDGSASEIEVDGGMINHWRGTAYIPNVKLDVLLKTLQEPQSDKHKQEDVISSRVVQVGENSQKLYLRLKRTKLITVVYDTEYDTTYRRVAADRALSSSISTKIVEIENAGTPQERALPEGNDHGFMWRLYSYWRYKQIGDGVAVEVESLTLSRNLPFLFTPFLRPVVNSTARDSITRTLSSMRLRFVS
jgi:putative flippase GtrA